MKSLLYFGAHINYTKIPLSIYIREYEPHFSHSKKKTCIKPYKIAFYATNVIAFETFFSVV